MLSKDELLRYPNYLLTKYQLEIYRQVVKYMAEKNLSKGDLAKQMNVSSPYISQILNGNFNYTLKKLIEIGLQIGQVPVLSFIPIKQYEFESTTSVSNPYIYSQAVTGDSNFKMPQSDIRDYNKSKPVSFNPKMKLLHNDKQQVAYLWI